MDALITELPSQSPPLSMDVLSPSQLEAWRSGASSVQKQWVLDHGFTGKAGQFLVLPNEHGQIERVLCGFDEKKELLWTLAHLPAKLPSGE